MTHPVSFLVSALQAGTRNSPGWGEHQTLQKRGEHQRNFSLSLSEAKELMQNLHPSCLQSLRR